MTAYGNIRLCEILIVGAGPVGLTLACVLAQQGVKVRIIDRNDGPTAYSKAIGIHARTLELMHTIGVAETLVARGNPMQRFRVNADQRRIIDSSFAPVASRYPFVLGLPQSVTESVLSQRLAELGVEVERQTEIVDVFDQGNPEQDGRHCQVALERADGRTEIVSTQWLCGCDGHHSAVRRMLGISFPGGDYGRAFILGDVKVDWDGPKEDLQFFISRHGYLLVIPMPRGMHRVIAQTDKSLADFQGERRPQASLEELQRIIDRNGPGGIRVHTPEWLTCAPFYYRMAETPRRGRAFLLGDALHLYSPLGAQGLNTGAHDAFNLGWKLAQVIHGTARPALLGTYAEERMDIAHKIAHVTSRTTTFITDTRPWFRALRKWLVPLVNRSRRVQVELPWLLAGLRQNYRDHTLSVGQANAHAAPGDRCPHAYVRTEAGLEPLAKLTHGREFTLLVLSRRDSAQVREKLVDWLDHGSAASRPRVYYVTREPLSQSDALQLPYARTLEDATSEVFNAFGLYAGLVLIRPDGHIALMARDVDQLDQVDEYFASRLWLPLGRTRAQPATAASG